MGVSTLLVQSVVLSVPLSTCPARDSDDEALFLRTFDLLLYLGVAIFYAMVL